VTVPVADVAGRVLVMVKLPFDPETAIPGPAFSEMTPVLVTVTMPPTFADTKMPEPGKIVVIPPPVPPALIVPVMLSIKMPAPTIRLPEGVERLFVSG